MAQITTNHSSPSMSQSFLYHMFEGQKNVIGDVVDSDNVESA